MKLFLLTLALTVIQNLAFGQNKIICDLKINNQLNLHQVKQNEPIIIEIIGTGAESFIIKAIGGTLTQIGDKYQLTTKPGQKQVALSMYAIEKNKEVALGTYTLNILQNE